jgi:hypothetical protein
MGGASQVGRLVLARSASGFLAEERQARSSHCASWRRIHLGGRRGGVGPGCRDELVAEGLLRRGQDTAGGHA